MKTAHNTAPITHTIRVRSIGAPEVNSTTIDPWADLDAMPDDAPFGITFMPVAA